jgi:hypothetical protein
MRDSKAPETIYVKTIYPHAARKSSRYPGIFRYFLLFFAGMRAIAGWSAGVAEDALPDSVRSTILMPGAPSLAVHP